MKNVWKETFAEKEARKPKEPVELSFSLHERGCPLLRCRRASGSFEPFRHHWPGSNGQGPVSYSPPDHMPGQSYPIGLLLLLLVLCFILLVLVLCCETRSPYVTQFDLKLLRSSCISLLGTEVTLGSFGCDDKNNNDNDKPA